MPQVLKPEVRDRIVGAGRDVFYESGYRDASMADIGRRAGVAPSNIYRYVDDKAGLFVAVLPDSLLDEHDRLLDERIDALGPSASSSGPADHLLDFWLAHRRSLAILLDHAGPSPRSDYQVHFVNRLVARIEQAAGQPLDPVAGEVVRLVFDNTRRAIAHLLRSNDDPDRLRRAVTGFWSYQIPGLDGLLAWASAETAPPGTADAT